VPLGKNKFVQLALERTLQLVKEIKGIEHLRTTLQPGLDIAILGGNDFYSQRAQLEARGLPRTLKSLEEMPPFVPLGVTLENAHKTGMGSSAALITSLVAALLVHLQVVDRQSLTEPLGEGRRLIHNVAQYVHCLAQGKVGSGFDVSSAIFGSHIYTRFDPSVIQPLMDATVPYLHHRRKRLIYR
jgi:phosphomevalonate kinase